MTSHRSNARRKPSKSHAAFALHSVARMLLRASALVCLLGVSALARAQTTTTGGACSGSMTGTIGLAVPQSDGTFLTIPNVQITTGVFGSAECQCAEQPNNPNINIEIKLTTALPAATAGTAEIWVGDSSCTNVTTRTSSSNTTCQRILTPSIQDFTINSTAATGSGLHYSLDAAALTQPFGHMCDPNVTGGPQPTSSNSIYLFIYTDPNNPLATCQLTLTEQMQGPVPVSDVSASGGDSAIELHWTPPGPGSYAPTFFQVLCADDCNNPIGSADTQVYSVCENGVLSRRDLTSGGSSSGGGVDGGVVSTDMSFTSLEVNVGNLGRTGPVVHANATSCPADMGVNTEVDGGIFGPTGPNGPGLLDPAYVCTSSLGPGESGARITGLNNGQLYHFRVVSVDAFGNATPSDQIDGTPQPTEDLWRRYRDAGGGPGGCFIATAAFGSYENRWVYVLRDFRDQVLLEHNFGRSFVEWYYQHSPDAAAWIAEHGGVRAITRLFLVPVIAAAWFWLYVPPVQKALVLLVVFALVFRKRIRRRLDRSRAA